jgi:hypothetical protein
MGGVQGFSTERCEVVPTEANSAGNAPGGKQDVATCDGERIGAGEWLVRYSLPQRRRNGIAAHNLRVPMPPILFYKRAVARGFLLV